MLRLILIVTGAVATGIGAPLSATEAERSWSLPEAVAFALENNPDVAIAGERLAASEAEYDRARAAFSPLFSLGTAYTGSDNPGQAFGWILNQGAFEPEMDFNRPGTIDNWNAHARVSWSLYDGGHRAGSREAARAGTGALQAQRDAVRNDIAFGVTRAFLQVAQADEAVRAVEARMAALDTAIDIAEAQVARGALLEAEALHLRVDRIRAQEDLLRARHASALARRGFVYLLGLPYQEVALVDLNAETVIAPPPEALPNRPEVEAARRQRDAAAAEVRVAKAGQRPRVEIFGRVDHDEGWQTNRSGQSWSAGIAAHFDLWDGGSAASQVRGARSRLREAEETQRKVSLAITRELEQVRLAREEARLRLDVAREGLQLAERNALLARARFEQGALLTTQLTEAEAGLTGARVRLAIAEHDVSLTTAALSHALGFFPISIEP